MPRRRGFARLRLQGRQLYAVAGKSSFADGVDDIAADRADIKGGFFQVGAGISVGDAFPGKKLHDGDLQGSGQFRQGADIRQSTSRFP